MRVEYDAAGHEISRFELSRNGAALALVVYLLAMFGCVSLALTKDPNPAFVAPPGSTSDLDVFRKIINRVHAGEAFHDATHDELRVHDYPTRSVFNWRTPVYAWWLSSEVGWRAGPALLATLVILTVVAFSLGVLEVNGLLPAALGTIFYVGATAWCFGGETHLFTEVWAGILIASSVCLYQRDLRALGFLSGLAALFYRELALPYCLVCLGLAIHSRRRREILCWMLGLSSFALFMFWHQQQVQSRLTSADLALTGGWIRFGGLRFVLSTAQTNIFLMPLPLWSTGIYLPTCVLGLFGNRSESGKRIGLTIGVYLAAFAIIGNPFNFYWGFLDAPLLATGISFAPAVLFSLLSKVVGAPMPVNARLIDA